VNPGLIFYHFGTVADLLLAALEEVSTRRLARYSAAVEAAATPSDLLAVATEIFREDLDEGYVTVLAEMIAGAGFSPGLGEQVAAVIAPWRAFAQQAIETIVSESPLASLVPVDDAAHAVVALYLGLEMLSHLDGDRAPALRLFSRASQLVTVFGGAGAGPQQRDTR
jgi:AcrR family transcriptional regulator